MALAYVAILCSGSSILIKESNGGTGEGIAKFGFSHAGCALFEGQATFLPRGFFKDAYHTSLTIFHSQQDFAKPPFLARVHGTLGP